MTGIAHSVVSGAVTVAIVPAMNTGTVRMCVIRFCRSLWPLG